MGLTITGGDSSPTPTITSAVTLQAGDNPVLITTGAEGAIGIVIGGDPDGFGIFGDNSYGWTITNQGTVSATSTASIGITLSAGGAIFNEGATSLISGTLQGVHLGAYGYIHNQGTISGGDDGGIVLVDGGNIFNEASGLIYGTGSGVLAPNSGVYLTNAGTIVGNSDDGVSIGSGVIINGATDNSAAVINGSQAGIRFADSYAVLRNYGTAYGSVTGVYLASGGSVTNTGSICGCASTGIQIASGDAIVTNSGSYASIYGGVAGIDAADRLTLDNGGTITGGFYDGVKSAGGTITNHAYGLLSGNRNGVFFEGGSSSDLVTNDGAITGNDGGGVRMAGGGTVANGTLALISGTYVGVQLGGTAANLTNDGTITGSDHFGVLFSATGDIVNGSATDPLASIYGYEIGIKASGTPASIVNFGTIIGYTQTGVTMVSGGTVTNSGTASLIDGGSVGVQSNAPATIANDGTISGYGGVGIVIGANSAITNGSPTNTSAMIYGGGYAGVYVYGDNTTITNDGSIVGDHAGITQQQGTGLAVINGTGGNTDAVISGYDVGVAISRSGRIVNNGTITATGTPGGFFDLNFGVAAYGGFTTVTNGSATNAAATITGNMGAAFLNGSGRITNFGTIGGAIIGALFLTHPGIINNSSTGVITTGTSGAGIFLAAGGVVRNSGLITAGYGIVGGVFLGPTTAPASITVVNTGTIIGSAGVAVVLMDAPNQVEMSSRAVFVGAVLGGSDIDTLLLRAGGPLGTLTDLNTGQFQDFDNLSLAAGARWRLAGNSALPDGATIANAGTLSMTGTLQAGPTLELTGAGLIKFGPTGAIGVGTSGAVTAGRLTIDATGRLEAEGRIAGRVVVDGTLDVTGTLAVQGAVSGAGTIVLESNALFSAVGALSVKNFLFAGSGTDETLVSTNLSGVPGRIFGFDDHDKIDLTGFNADASLTTYAARTLTLHELGGAGIATLHFSIGYTLADFGISADGSGGTLITHT